MKFFYILIYLMILFLFQPASFAQAAENQVHTISIDASSTSTTAPDQATLVIGITNHAETAQEAQQANAEIASTITTNLHNLGLSSEQIKTRNYNFHPTYNNQQNHENELTGYTVDNTVYVTLNDVTAVGNVIDTALSSGANKINSISFSIRNPNKLKEQALRQAIKDARTKADIIADALGKQIIGIQSVSESGGSYQPRFNELMLAKANISASTPIEPGTIDVEASVHIDFIIN